MGGYVYVLASATIAAAILGLERLRPASGSQRGEWLNNATAFGLILFSQGFLGAVWATSETHLVNGLGGGLIDLRGLPWVAGAAIYLVAMDVGEYAFHRAQHAFPWMWAMHSLHHSDRALNATTTVRHFWLDPALKSVSIWLAVALMFKVNQTILACYVIASFYNLVSHANLRLGFGPLSWLWNSPQYHRLHHSTDAAHYNANFAALLPIFDVLTGAYHRPAPAEFPPTGLEDRPITPLEMIVWPIRGVFRRVRATPRSQTVG